jgi:hypothetical protein
VIGMARNTSRSDSPELPAFPPQAANTVAELANTNTAAPATAADPANPLDHPVSHKPNSPTGPGHGSGK